MKNWNYQEDSIQWEISNANDRERYMSFDSKQVDIVGIYWWPVDTTGVKAQKVKQKQLVIRWREEYVNRNTHEKG